MRAIDALQASGKPEQALKLAEKALEGARPSERAYWELVLRKSQILETLNRREVARDWIESFSPLDHCPADLAILLIREQAAIESALGRFGEADRHLGAALVLATGSGQIQMAAVLEVRRAFVQIQLGALESADQSLSAAEEYARHVNERNLDPYILHYRGEIGLAGNKFEDAIPAFQGAVDRFREMKRNIPAAKSTISMAWCYYRLGRIDKALDLYREALRNSAPEDRHLALGHLGNIFWEEHDFVKAADYYRQAASGAKGRDQSYYVRWLNNLAVALVEQGKWPEAERINNQALALEKRIDGSPGLSLALVNEGRIETQKGHYDAAAQLLHQVAESRHGDPSFTLDAYSALAELYARQGNVEQVKHQFESALALADQIRAHLREDENKITYLSSLTNVHRKYVDFLMDRGDRAGAFAVAESSRGRLLRERLNLPHYRSQSHTIGEYQAAARASGTTFLAYWVGSEHSYLWAISGTRFERYLLPAEREIRGLVEQYQHMVEAVAAPRPEDTAAGEQLYNLLLARCSGVLKKGGKYVIVPDGPLYGLNFETLPVPGDHPHYWIEDATVAVAPSLDLLLARRAVHPHGPLLLVGDANEWNPEFPKLLYARKEIEGIENGYTNSAPTVLAGAFATPSAYQKAQPTRFSYIHFATHASANKNAPFDSAIILSKDNGGGKLSVKDVLDSRLNAELVTISACHSAGARTYWGEGLVGFAWAFLQSGAHGVVAGLWDVSDYASPRLMHDLYVGLAASKTPADALRQAKLRLIAGGKYASPYYWGALQLYEGAL